MSSRGKHQSVTPALDTSIALTGGCGEHEGLIQRVASVCSKRAPTATMTRQVSCLLGNLVSKPSGLQVHMSPNWYSPALLPRRYNAAGITSTMIRIVKALLEDGRYLVKIQEGFNGTYTGQATVVAASPDLSKMFTLLEPKVSPVTGGVVELLRLRDMVAHAKYDGATVKTLVDYEDTKATVAMRDKLVALNELLGATQLRFSRDTKAKLAKDTLDIEGHELRLLTNTLTYRGFTYGSWSSGGRYAASYQQVSKHVRPDILMNEQPVAVVDYRSSVLVCLYAYALGEDLIATRGGEDPYHVQGVARSEVKEQVLYITGGGYAPMREKAEQYKTLERFDAVCSTLEALQLVKRGDHGALQHLEASVASHVVDSLVHMGIPVLCIHDAFVVPAEHLVLTVRFMQEAYNVLLGVAVGVSFKQFVRDYITVESSH